MTSTRIAAGNADGSLREGSGTGTRGSFAIALLVAGTFFMENLDATVITPAVPKIAEAFGVPAVDLNVGVSAYMLTLGIFIPVSGWIAERFGPRRVFSAAIVLFTLASALCGLTDDLGTFVAARILQGIGGALMVPVGRLVVLRVTPKEKLIGAIAALTWPALVAPVLGPPVGGLISDYLDWRWIFYLNLPLGLIAFVLALRLIEPQDDTEAPPFDWSGFLLTGTALFCLLAAAESLGRPDADLIWAGGVGLLGLVLLTAGIVHLRRAETPMIDLSSLRTKSFAITIWGGSLFRMGINAVPFLIPVMFQIGFGHDAFSSGLILMAVFAGNLAIKPLTTAIIQAVGFRRVLLINGILNALALGACALFSQDTPLGVMLAILFIGGMTRSMQFTALNTIAFADIPEERMNPANTLFSAATQLSMGLGIALGAIGWRLGEAFANATGAGPLAPFQVAFLIVAGVGLLSLIDLLTLSHRAGETVARRKAGGEA